LVEGSGLAEAADAAVVIDVVGVVEVESMQ
jgi:hypothetical protein